MSEQQRVQPFHTEAAERLLSYSREAFEAAGTQGLVVRQEIGTGVHLLQALFALTVFRQTGRRTLIIQPGVSLLEYSVTEARQLAQGECVASARELNPATYHQPDILITNGHEARIGPIADRCPRDHFGVVIFDQAAGAFTKTTLSRLALEFTYAGQHVFWNPLKTLPFLDARRLTALETVEAGAITITRLPHEYGAALAAKRQ